MFFQKNQKKIDQQQQVLLSSDLDENLEILRSMYQDCFDVVFHMFLIRGQMRAVLIYVEGLSNVEEIHTHVLSPLMSEVEGAGLIHWKC